MPVQNIPQVSSLKIPGVNFPRNFCFSEGGREKLVTGRFIPKTFRTQNVLYLGRFVPKCFVQTAEASSPNRKRFIRS